MKLYFAQGACSLAAHIALIEAGVTHDTERVDLQTKKTAHGADFLKTNPKGYVPTLQFDRKVLTENVAVLQYIADLNPAVHLAPARDSFERYRLQEWLAYISTEVHKSFKPFFTPGSSAEEKARGADQLGRRLDYIEQRLDGNPFLMGGQFTVADAYLYTLFGWLPRAGVDAGKWPKLQRHHQRVGERSAVKQALKAEQAA